MSADAYDVVRFALCPRWYHSERQAVDLRVTPGAYVDSVLQGVISRYFELSPVRRSDDLVGTTVRELWAKHPLRKRVFADPEQERFWGQYALRCASMLCSMVAHRQPFSVARRFAVELGMGGFLAVTLDAATMKMTGTVRLELYRPRLFVPRVHAMVLAVGGVEGIRRQYSLVVDEVRCLELDGGSDHVFAVDAGFLEESRCECMRTLARMKGSDFAHNAGEHCVLCSISHRCRYRA